MDDLSATVKHGHSVFTSDESVQCGDWYWVQPEDKEKPVWLGCVAKIGSNYVKLFSVPTDSGYEVARIHNNDFLSRCELVVDPSSYILGQVTKHQDDVNAALDEIKSLTKRLGISKGHALEVKRGGGSGNQLAVISQSTDIKEHEAQLLKAKEETLPELFERVKDGTKNVASWMKAETLPLKIAGDQMKEDISDIDSRIFNVKLYGGIDENIHVLKRGAHADMADKIHLFQNKKFMDEECLANYVSGGMDFNDVDAFCDWLVLDENLKRILPYPKSVVPIQIRRHEKLRTVIKFSDIFDNFVAAKLDQSTYFLVRNGEAVYFVDGMVELDGKVFPDKSEFDPTQPIYFNVGSFGRIEWMYENEFMQRKSERIAFDKEHEQWKKDNPKVGWLDDPYRHNSAGEFDYESWELLNSDSLYFDDFNEHYSSLIKSYNRVTLVLQGLLDRSEILHPHANVQTWDNQSFNDNIQLVYDHDRTLTDGEKPDIEAYLADRTSGIKKGSVVYGQADFWLEHERDKEQERRDRSYRDYGDILYYSGPYGNPGPGRVAEVAGMAKSGAEARFSWHRQRLVYRHGDDSPVKATITVPVEQLFNMDAYTPGDYKIFYKDPRTRREYIQWAPMLLAAEDYHAGLLEPKSVNCMDVDWV